MTRTATTGRRGATAAILAVGGGGLAVATWIGGEHGLAVGLLIFYAIAAVVAFVWAGRDSDYGAILAAGGDERQRGLDQSATAIAGLAMVFTCIAGAIFSAAVNHGDIGAFGLIAAVGGATYVIALVVLRRRA